MKKIPEQAVIDVIQNQYDHIFSAEKKVADFILENPEVAVNANVSELAGYSGVSDATVIRFCKHIGYEGYYQLKICLSRDLGRKQMSDAHKNSEEEDTVLGFFKSLANNLVTIGENLDPEIFTRCVRLIRNSNQVHLIAVGNTSPLAQYMGFRLGRLGIRSTFNMVPECEMNNINLAGEGDVLVAISQSGSSKQVVQAIELAKNKGLEIIAITAHERSPVSNLADYLLLTKTNEPSFHYYKRNSHYRETAVIDALIRFIIMAGDVDTGADMPEIILADSKL